VDQWFGDPVRRFLFATTLRLREPPVGACNSEKYVMIAYLQSILRTVAAGVIAAMGRF